MSTPTLGSIFLDAYNKKKANEVPEVVSDITDADAEELREMIHSKEFELITIEEQDVLKKLLTSYDNKPKVEMPIEVKEEKTSEQRKEGLEKAIKTLSVVARYADTEKAEKLNKAIRTINIILKRL